MSPTLSKLTADRDLPPLSADAGRRRLPAQPTTRQVAEQAWFCLVLIVLISLSRWL